MNFRINWEALGIGASLACAIHSQYYFFLFTDNIFLEIFLLGSAFVIGFSTLWHGYKKHHHHWGTLVPFTFGMLLFTINQFVIFPYSSFVFVIPAVIAVISAHILNHRFCREANHCHVRLQSLTAFFQNQAFSISKQFNEFKTTAIFT